MIEMWLGPGETLETIQLIGSLFACLVLVVPAVLGFYILLKGYGKKT